MTRKIRMTVVCVMAIAAVTNAATIHNNRTIFEAALGDKITDDYENPGYAGFVPATNAAMSAVLGETAYTTTGLVEHNIVYYLPENTSDNYYCAGCNGSYQLDFTTTSVGDASGVFGAGFDVDANTSYQPYHAFVTFGDASTADFELPAANSFWGITSSINIASIHVGLADGLATTDGSFSHDNLTIGNVIPEPATGALLVLGLAGLAGRRSRQALHILGGSQKAHA